MMVELFHGDHLDVESRMNRWLARVNQINIIKVSHRYSDGSVSIMILYENKT